MRRALWQGFSLALIGVLGLIYWGAFARLHTLQMWGFWIFIGSLFLIAIGLLPYRRLSLLQTHPNELQAVGLDYLTFHVKGQKIVTIPFSAIDHFRYSEDARRYGLAFWLKPHSKEKVLIYSKKGFAKLRKPPAKAQGADLFFPYFSQRSYEELRKWQLEGENEDA
ncbi:hypothetical protein [Candidatus Protochlamydia phocaeensis]|uniref:hypothetical protein n=1 Tax=Candidatus Protochlamydia phocaeensis TaxID=1414722 RepID=UPI000838969E|nr:hypothetical protein [Candidatus Protochlamydia phocaeensis]